MILVAVRLTSRPMRMASRGRELGLKLPSLPRAAIRAGVMAKKMVSSFNGGRSVTVAISHPLNLQPECSKSCNS